MTTPPSMPIPSTSSFLSSISFEEVIKFANSPQGYLAIGSAIGVAAAATYAYSRYSSNVQQTKKNVEFLAQKEMKAAEERAQAEAKKRNEEKALMATFAKLNITEYHLPGIASSVAANVRRLEPHFDAETAKEFTVIEQMIDNARDNDSKTPAPNLIFCGEPGIGKTMSLEHLCIKKKIPFIRIPSGAMENHLRLGTHITAFNEVLRILEKYAPLPAYIIMDDSEELLASRPEHKKKSDVDDTKAPWLAEQERFSETMIQRRAAMTIRILEVFGKDRNVALGATSNRPFIIEEALMNRSRVLVLHRPEFLPRKKIIIDQLEVLFKGNEHILRFFDLGRIEKMTLATEGWAGRDIVLALQELPALVALANGDISQDMIDAVFSAKSAAIRKRHVSMDEIVTKASAVFQEASKQISIGLKGLGGLISRGRAALFNEA